MDQSSFYIWFKGCVVLFVFYMKKMSVLLPYGPNQVPQHQKMHPTNKIIIKIIQLCTPLKLQSAHSNRAKCEIWQSFLIGSKGFETSFRILFSPLIQN